MDAQTHSPDYTTAAWKLKWQCANHHLVPTLSKFVAFPVPHQITIGYKHLLRSLKPHGFSRLQSDLQCLWQPLGRGSVLGTFGYLDLPLTARKGPVLEPLGGPPKSWHLDRWMALDSHQCCRVWWSCLVGGNGALTRMENQWSLSVLYWMLP